MADFIPNSDDALKTWCTNFKSKIATSGATVGLTPAQITGLQTKCDAINGRIDDKAAKKNAWQSSVANSNTGNNADLADIRASVASIKTNGGFTNAIGADLGVTGSAAAFDPNAYKAQITSATVTAPAQVTIKFSKASGNIDGVHVYSRLQGQDNWRFLARDTIPPYVDTTPLAAAGKPEVREYRVRAVVNDEEIGDYSDTVQVTVT
jgi:hypothetical protein